MCVRVCEGVCAETKQKSFSGCSGTGWVVSSGRTVAVWRRRSEQLNVGLHVRATGVVCEPREFGSTNRTAKELSPGLWRAHSVRNWVEGFNNMWQSDLKKKYLFWFLENESDVHMKRTCLKLTTFPRKVSVRQKVSLSSVASASGFSRCANEWDICHLNWYYLSCWGRPRQSGAPSSLKPTLWVVSWNWPLL